MPVLAAACSPCVVGLSVFASDAAPFGVLCLFVRLGVASATPSLMSLCACLLVRASGCFLVSPLASFDVTFLLTGGRALVKKKRKGKKKTTKRKGSSSPLRCRIFLGKGSFPSHIVCGAKPCFSPGVSPCVLTCGGTLGFLWGPPMRVPHRNTKGYPFVQSERGAKSQGTGSKWGKLFDNQVKCGSPDGRICLFGNRTSGQYITPRSKFPGGIPENGPTLCGERGPTPLLSLPFPFAEFFGGIKNLNLHIDYPN